MQSEINLFVYKFVGNLLTKRVFTIQFFFLLTKQVLTKYVFVFAHETKAHETSFSKISRNEISRNEFFFFS